MNEVRITSGSYKGRRVATPGGKTHPMGNREKIALFNMVSEYLPGSRVLDAYAGSGALGIEALSRGAAEVEFLEKSPTAAKIIRSNLRDLGLKERIFTGDAIDFTANEGFDLVLADPPYDAFDLAGVEYLAGFLKSGGIMVLSHPDETPEISELKLLKTRKYAAARLSVYAKI
ncbi:RsmD family RNA methyltransferase [Candidatus Saccharibacteria bacterium]|nr:RsmD family RNA methyltransferase [Candidatus Saccharibacteria bacterium]